MNRHQHGGCRFVPVQCRTGTQTKCSITSCNYTRDGDVMPGGKDGENTDDMYKFVGLVPERLAPVKCATWGPFIFVNLDPECRDLEDQIGPLMEDLKGRLETPLEINSKLWLDFKCNWKLMGAVLMQNAAAGHIDPPGCDSEAWPAFAEEGVGLPWVTEEASSGALRRLEGVVGARLYWLFPNVLFALCDTHAMVILLQATSMAKTLCRFFLMTAADNCGAEAEAEANRLAYRWIEHTRTCGAMAEAGHQEAVLHGTPSRPDTIAGTSPVEASLESYQLNRFVIGRICTEHRYYWNAPITDAAMLMRGVR